jgi:hypothetical protein
MSMESAGIVYEPRIEANEEHLGTEVFKVWDAAEEAQLEAEKREMGLGMDLHETSGTVYSLEDPSVKVLQATHERQEARRRQRRIEARRHGSMPVSAEVTVESAQREVRDPHFSIQPFAKGMQRTLRFMEQTSTESAAA